QQPGAQIGVGDLPNVGQWGQPPVSVSHLFTQDPKCFLFDRRPCADSDLAPVLPVVLRVPKPAALQFDKRTFPISASSHASLLYLQNLMPTGKRRTWHGGNLAKWTKTKCL